MMAMKVENQSYFLPFLLRCEHRLEQRETHPLPLKEWLSCAMCVHIEAEDGPVILHNYSLNPYSFENIPNLPGPVTLEIRCLILMHLL